MFEDEEEEEQLFEDEEDEEQLFEDDEEQLFEDDEGEYEGDDVYGNEGFYEDQTDSEDEFVVAPPVYLPRPTVVARFPVLPTRPRSLYLGSESSDLSGDERGVGGSGRNWRSGGDGTATSRPTENNFIPSDGNVVASKGAGSSRSNDSSWNGFQGPICPICYENWTGEGQHCVCCLPCGHLYGLSCITIWLLRPNSQKCPQCNDECELEDVRRLYGMQLPTTGVEELQEKVKSLEAKCASLELKDADWLRKEAEWKKKEADFKQQLNQHKEAEAGVAKDIVIQAGANERRDPVDNPEPSNALSQMKL
nr:E3 ubiquitin-protein ligase [Fagopyrum tataricum]